MSSTTSIPSGPVVAGTEPDLVGSPPSIDLEATASRPGRAVPFSPGRPPRASRATTHPSRWLPRPSRWLPRTGLWRHADFLHLWAAETVSQLGTQLTMLALPLTAALTLDARAGQMGLLAAAGSAPVLLFGLPAGVWVDRLRRRPILVATDLGRAALLALIPLLWLLDALRIELLYAVAFGVGTLTVFFDIAYVSFLPTLVRRDQLLEGNGKLQASASFAQVAGPGAGGWLIGLVTAPFAIVVNALSFLASAWFIGRIRTVEPAMTPRAERRHLLAEVGEGLRLVLANPLLRALAGCSATTSLFGWAFLAVYVLYLTEDLGLGAAAIGSVFAVGGAGALIGALLAEPLARRLGVGPTILWSRLAVGLGGMVVPVAVLAPDLALPMILFAEWFQWLAIVVADVNTISLRQAITPDRLQGRVNATWKFLVAGMVPLGGLLGGALGELYSVRLVLVVGVLGMLAAFGFVAFSPVRALRTAPVPEEDQAHA
jgi:MFS family permease